VIVIVAIVLGVHSCQVSARNDAMKTYASNASNLITQSNQLGHTLLSQLAQGGGSTTLTTHLAEAETSASGQLTQAENLSVPDEMRSAHTNLLLTLTMRRDAIMNVAAEISQALGNTTSTDAINSITANIARFYASDVVWKDYTAPLISGALKSAGLSGVTLEPGQFLTDIHWLDPATVASELHVSLPASSSSSSTAGAKAAPGVHGHKMDACSVSGTQLQTGSPNSIPASPPPTFTCMFTNDGQNPEMNIVVKVSVGGTSISGQATVANDTPGQQSTVNVPLNASPKPGTYTVSATVQRVPGETSVTHNTLTFPVTFQ
jgi:hypothetical protein